MANAYEVSAAPKPGTVRLAGWVPGATGLKFFGSDDEAMAWLDSSLNAGSRTVYRLVIGEVDKMSLVPAAPCYLRAE